MMIRGIRVMLNMAAVRARRATRSHHQGSGRQTITQRGSSITGESPHVSISSSRLVVLVCQAGAVDELDREMPIPALVQLALQHLARPMALKVSTRITRLAHASYAAWWT
jgi:hypothetical protein